MRRGLRLPPTQLIISAVTVAGLLVVAGRRSVAPGALRLIDEVGFDIVSVTAAAARQVAEAYHCWGKGVHPAGLNLGDGFARADVSSAMAR